MNKLDEVDFKNAFTNLEMCQKAEQCMYVAYISRPMADQKQIKEMKLNWKFGKIGRIWQE